MKNINILIHSALNLLKS